MDPAVRSMYAAYLECVNQQQRWTASRQRDILRHALPKLPNIHHVVFTAASLTVKTFDIGSTGRGTHLHGLDPIQQGLVDDHLSEVVHILGNAFQSVRSLTVEINGQLSIADRRAYFLQHIERFTARLGPCFCAEDVPSLIDLIGHMTGLQTLDVEFSPRSSTSDTSFWALRELLQMPTCINTSFRRVQSISWI